MHTPPELKLEQLMLEKASPEAESQMGVYQAKILLHWVEIFHFQVWCQIREGYLQQS